MDDSTPDRYCETGSGNPIPFRLLAQLRRQDALGECPEIGLHFLVPISLNSAKPIMGLT